jgi:hypothetical protein
MENGQIYPAKWYGTGSDRAAQVESCWPAPPQYQAGDKVPGQGLPYPAEWIDQGVSPATQSAGPSGSARKALCSIPGEPSGAPALGSVAVG